MEEVEIVEPGPGLPEQLFRERYARTPEETWTEACDRVAEHVSNAEENGKRNIFKEKFAKELKSNRFMPGGRIWYGAGRNVAQLLNCFCVPVKDSREGWGKLLYDTCVISGTGGGIGANFSDVRGRGFSIKGTGGFSTGAVSIMKMQDSVSEELRQGGGRRAALMQCLNINHPDILEFLEVKLDKGLLNNANISIVMNIDPDEFVRLVREDGDIELEFNGLKTGETINAKWLWNKLIDNAWESGDPGILNSFLANRMSNTSYIGKLTSTNPCVTGDTVIATIDGPRTFASLAEEGNDVLVYAWHPKTKLPVIRMMRRPHKTKTNVKILEVEFDSGLVVRCTPDHNFYSFRGKKVKAQDLKIGQSIRAWSMSEHRDGHFRVHGWNTERNCSNHQWVARMMWEWAYGSVPKGMIVHHKDENLSNNNLENLEILTPTEHNQIHYASRFENGFDGTARNHKVIAIREGGREDVYNGCVDDAHTYIILDHEPISGIQSGIVSANCGEIWLEPYDCCCLGNIVLPRFVNGPVFDWDLFDETVRIGIRFLDNVLSVNDFPLPEIKDKCSFNRRIGLGVMGLHTALLEMGLEYGSEEALEFIDKLFDIMKNVAYDESITLAAEKGPFPGYRPEFLKSNFIKGLKPALRNKIKHHGIRNCALMTVPPTGTTSMISGNGVSSGIESLFAPAYYRRVRASDEKGIDYYYQELVITDEYKKFGDLAVGAYDISLSSHLKTQAIIQKHIDNAVSKTINIPADFPVKNLKETLLDYLPLLKGVTLYRQGSKGMEPLEHIPVQEVASLLEDDHDVANIEELSRMDCTTGACSI